MWAIISILVLVNTGWTKPAKVHNDVVAVAVPTSYFNQIGGKSKLDVLDNLCAFFMSQEHQMTLQCWGNLEDKEKNTQADMVYRFEQDPALDDWGNCPPTPDERARITPEQLVLWHGRVLQEEIAHFYQKSPHPCFPDLTIIADPERSRVEKQRQDEQEARESAEKAAADAVWVAKEQADLTELVRLGPGLRGDGVSVTVGKIQVSKITSRGDRFSWTIPLREDSASTNGSVTLVINSLGSVLVTSNFTNGTLTTNSATTGGKYFMFLPLPDESYPRMSIVKEENLVLMDYGYGRVLALNGQTSQVDFEHSRGITGSQVTASVSNKTGLELKGTTVPIFFSEYCMGDDPLTYRRGCLNRGILNNVKLVMPDGQSCSIAGESFLQYLCVKTVNGEPAGLGECAGALQPNRPETIQVRGTRPDTLRPILEKACGEKMANDYFLLLAKALVEPPPTVDGLPSEGQVPEVSTAVPLESLNPVDNSEVPSLISGEAPSNPQEPLPSIDQ